MNQFKKIMAQSHTQNKDCLHKLYTDRQIYISSLSSSQQPIEDEKIYIYRGISFNFVGTGFRTPQRTILYVWVPGEMFGCAGELGDESVPCEDWLLRNLWGPVNALAKSLLNDHKDTREKPDFSMQETNAVVHRRSGEYLKYADCVLLLEDYRVYDKTAEIREMLTYGESEDGGEQPEGDRGSNGEPHKNTYRWTNQRYLPGKLQLSELYSGYTVQIDSERRVWLGEITADLTCLTALKSPGQLYTLAWLLEILLLWDRPQEEDLKSCCERLVQKLFGDSRDVVLTSRTHGYELQLEQVRGLDLLMAAFRLRKP